MANRRKRADSGHRASSACGGTVAVERVVARPWMSAKQKRAAARRYITRWHKDRGCWSAKHARAGECVDIDPREYEKAANG